MRVLLPLLVVSGALWGCVPLNTHGALREAYNKVEAENQTFKKDLAQVSAESKRLQQEVESLKAANESMIRQARELAANLQQMNKERAVLAEQVSSAKAALAAKEAQQQAMTRQSETPPAPPPAAEPPRALESALKDQIADGTAVVRRGERSLTVELLEPALYYNSASATIKPAGLKVLKRIADVLKDGTGKEIRVEAHTDVVIHTGRFPSNADLAVARAKGVLRYLKTLDTADQARLSAVGYADPQAAVVNEGSRPKTRNRRVEIIVRYR
jgi:chemotaxis protein MotB